MISQFFCNINVYVVFTIAVFIILRTAATLPLFGTVVAGPCTSLFATKNEESWHHEPFSGPFPNKSLLFEHWHGRHLHVGCVK